MHGMFLSWTNLDIRLFFKSNFSHPGPLTVTTLTLSLLRSAHTRFICCWSMKCPQDTDRYITEMVYRCSWCVSLSNGKNHLPLNGHKHLEPQVLRWILVELLSETYIAFSIWFLLLCVRLDLKIVPWGKDND